MNVLVFEWMVGGGLLFDREDLDVQDPIFRQGDSMWRSICEDFRWAGHQVRGTIDARLAAANSGDGLIPIHRGDELPARLSEMADSVDAIFLVAPETGQRLLGSIDWVAGSAAPLISAGRELVELASSKHATSEWLRNAGIQSFDGLIWKAGESWPPAVAVPAVFKPDDGASGEGIQVIQTWGNTRRPEVGTWRCERLLAGAALSIAAICREQGFVLLEPVWQRFSQENPSCYIGGDYPVSSRSRQLAQELAEAALACLPNPIGFVGFDMIVDESSSVATIVEINPRLTTSYVGLRQRCDVNLARVLLADSIPAISWRREPLEFRI